MTRTTTEKILRIVLAVCLLTLFLCPPASAADIVQIRISSDTDKLSVGTVLRCAVNVTDECNVSSIGVIPQYDAAVFRLTAGECLCSGAVLSDFDVGEGIGVAAFSDTVKLTGDVFTFTLEVIALPAGDTTVSADVSMRSGTDKFSAYVMPLVFGGTQAKQEPVHVQNPDPGPGKTAETEKAGADPVNTPPAVIRETEPAAKDAAPETPSGSKDGSPAIDEPVPGDPADTDSVTPDDGNSGARTGESADKETGTGRKLFPVLVAGEAAIVIFLIVFLVRRRRNRQR